jgi:hypothetical protein
VFAENPGAIEGGAESSNDADAFETGTDGPVTVPPGAEGGSDGGADAWTPAQLDDVDELALWLEPSPANLTVSNGVLSVWKDRSKNHNDAKGMVSGPTVHAALLNGHGTAHFEQDVVLTIDDAPTLQFSTDQVYIAAIVRLIPTGGVGYFFSKAVTAPSGGGPLYNGGLELWAAPGAVDGGALATFPRTRIAPAAGDELAWGDAVFDDGKFHFVAVRRIDATSLSLAVDGQTPGLAQTEALSINEVGRAVRLGGVRYGNVSKPLDLDIAEIVVVHRSASIVSDDTAASVRTYLTTKYGL